jgi:four helix bundle protein
MSGPAVRVREDVVVTSGSFRREGSRWPFDVKGKPVEPVGSTLDIECLTGSRKDMNDQEVTMSNALTNTNLIAHEKALEAAGEAIALVMRVPAPLKSIADQVIRSASSVPANLAEGHGRTGRDRLHFWRIAYASAKEVDSHLTLLTRVGVMNDTRAKRALEAFDEVRAMTWRLLNPRSRGP